MESTNGKHADQWTATLQIYVYPVFKGTLVAAIDDNRQTQPLRWCIGRSLYGNARQVRHMTVSKILCDSEQ